MIQQDNDGTTEFVARWRGVTASELSTSQSFLLDLCRLLGIPAPHPTLEQDYLFERPISFTHGDGSTSAGRIDLYKRGAFVLESKKLKAPTHTKGFDDAMLRARSQAEAYARALPTTEGRPPFVVVVDVGNRIELYAEFSRSGATYTPFPDPRTHRITLEDLRRPEIRERLRKVWTAPMSLDPSRESARVTREIAERLAALARSLEDAGHAAEDVAQFLMRCLFTMFAEDVRLLPPDSFRELLMKYADRPDLAMRMLGQLWRDMDSGGFSATIAADLLRFNGKLFKSPDTLPLTRDQIRLLVDAARADWRHVEPAIFGTLLERALEPAERHKLGAHYTPRAYVDRLVLPTVIEPLRAEWSDSQAAALTLDAEGRHDEAVAELRRFHHRLCTVRVLDPACGSGNFLYVTLEHLKRLEGEVLNALDELGFRQTALAIGGERADAAAGETVDPHNLLGIEINPRAAAIAEVVLWIGYLQWHFRTRGDVTPPQPVIRDFSNIEHRDAILAYDRIEYVTDERGVPITRWDGKTTKESPVTGEQIPDEAARVPLERYVNPRKASWPEADFVVGNPPFIGNKRMRLVLGDGYVEALRGVWVSVPESADLVMYWWHAAGELTRRGALRQFGLITTNSVRQEFNRRVLEPYLAAGNQRLSLIFAVPDHPWVDSVDGAAVRIAMTVAALGSHDGLLLTVSHEQADATGEVAVTLHGNRSAINADLTIGTNVSLARRLLSNRGLACPGVQLSGQGFIVPLDSVPVVAGSGGEKSIVRPFVIGNDLMKQPRQNHVVDATDLDEAQLRTEYPAAYQWLLTRVKPERDQNPRESYRRSWWRFSEARLRFRPALRGLRRVIATCRTAKHRIFQFLPAESVCETTVVTVALDEPAMLGYLSSVVHDVWVRSQNATLEDRPRYNVSVCFDTFPLPDLAAASSRQVGEMALRLDAHRKRQQAAHPHLTLTAVYNVLEKLRASEPLSAKERAVHDDGVVSVLRHLHDDLDAAVLAAYGWSDALPFLRVACGNDAAADGVARAEAKRQFDQAILARLVALNSERAAEEARGSVHWLRPEFQNREGAPVQSELDARHEGEGEGEAGEAGSPASKRTPWPKDAVAQVRAVADALSNSAAPLSADELAASFTARGPWKKRLPQLLKMLVAVGRAREQDGRYASVER